MKHTRHNQEGFSLVELVLVLSVISMIAAGVLVGSIAGQALDNVEVTVQRMIAIEDALSGFSEANARLPCPASGAAAPNTVTYGKEAATPGTCTGVNFGPSAAPIAVGGTVPTRTLGLPDEYMLDGWGRRFTYVVTQAATLDLTAPTPAITINGAADVGLEALISHGPNGQGAFIANGSAVNARFNSGSTDANELENGPTAAASFNNVLYQGDKTSTFDDIVRYQTTFPIVP